MDKILEQVLAGKLQSLGKEFLDLVPAENPAFMAGLLLSYPTQHHIDFTQYINVTLELSRSAHLSEQVRLCLLIKFLRAILQWKAGMFNKNVRDIGQALIQWSEIVNGVDRETQIFCDLMSVFTSFLETMFARQITSFNTYIGWAGSRFLGSIPYDYGIFEFDRDLYDPLINPTNYGWQRSLEAISAAFGYLSTKYSNPQKISDPFKDIVVNALSEIMQIASQETVSEVESLIISNENVLNRQFKTQLGLSYTQLCNRIHKTPLPELFEMLNLPRAEKRQQQATNKGKEKEYKKVQKESAPLKEIDPNKITILVGSIAQDIRKKKFVIMTEINSKLTNIIKDFGQEAVSKALGELVAFEGGDQAQVFAWKLLIKAASRYRLLSPNVSRSLQVQVEKLSVEPVVN